MSEYGNAFLDETVNERLLLQEIYRRTLNDYQTLNEDLDDLRDLWEEEQEVWDVRKGE
jgi:hypothetical protein